MVEYIEFVGVRMVVWVRMGLLNLLWVAESVRVTRMAPMVNGLADRAFDNRFGSKLRFERYVWL